MAWILAIGGWLAAAYRFLRDFKSMVAIQQENERLAAENERVHEQNKSLESQLKAVQDRRELLKQFEYRDNAYWKDGRPFCVQCLESGESRSLVVSNTLHCYGHCARCGNEYADVFPDDLPEGGWL